MRNFWTMYSGVER